MNKVMRIALLSTMCIISVVAVGEGLCLFANEVPVVVINNDQGANQKEISDIKVDKWGRSLKTTNLPKGAQYFPYLCEDVPNWVYEEILGYMQNTNKCAVWSGYGVDKFGTPCDEWNVYQKNTPNDFWKSGYTPEVYYKRLEKYLNFCLNIDYRTLKRSEIKEILSECIGEKTFYNFDKAVDAWYKYYISNKIIVSGKAVIIPEGFHLTKYNEPVLTAYINFKVSSQGSVPYNYCSIGEYGGALRSKKDLFETDKSYNGLFICPTIWFEGDSNNYKLDYDYLRLYLKNFTSVE